MTTITAHRAFLDDVLARQTARRREIDPISPFPPPRALSSAIATLHPTSSPTTLPTTKHAYKGPNADRDGPPSRNLSANATGSSGASQLSKANVVNYVAAEETVRNDYTAWYGRSGKTGAEYIQGARDDELCDEYPALKRLMALKKDVADQYASPPLYAALSSPCPASITLALSPTRFDVILITPVGTWQETAALPVRELSSDPSFVFLWVGRGDQGGLEKGRECLAKWGFRRAEDIVWVKRRALEVLAVRGGRGLVGDDEETDEVGRGVGQGGLLASQKEHCLMGIRGTVRRSTDTRFAHCNVDTDVLIWDEEPGGQHACTARYPPYLYTLIESFCLGTRRLQLFAPPDRCRRGWVTAHTDVFPTPPSTHGLDNLLEFDSESYPSLLPGQEERGYLPYVHEIELLRPKSPSKGPKGLKKQSVNPHAGFPYSNQTHGPEQRSGIGSRIQFNQPQFRARGGDGGSGLGSGSASGSGGAGLSGGVSLGGGGSFGPRMGSSRPTQGLHSRHTSVGGHDMGPQSHATHPLSFVNFQPAFQAAPGLGPGQGPGLGVDSQLAYMMAAMQLQQQQQQQQSHAYSQSIPDQSWSGGYAAHPIHPMDQMGQLGQMRPLQMPQMSQMPQMGGSGYQSSGFSVPPSGPVYQGAGGVQYTQFGGQGYGRGGPGQPHPQGRLDRW